MTQIISRTATGSWFPRGQTKPDDRVGVDVQSVEEVIASWSIFKDRYLTRTFLEHEVTYARRHPYVAARYLAGQFAAREAVLKLLEIDDPLPMWRHILVKCDESSCRVELCGPALYIAISQGITDIVLSISRDRHFAMAVAMPNVGVSSKEEPL